MNRRTALFALAGMAPALRAASSRAIIVELFTSEGCSSCPPADQMLARLEREGWSGVDIIALSEHVDYWNHLGWSDAFSSPLFSARQQQYASRFRVNTVYTPQMVVNGYTEAVGSDWARVREALERAAGLPAAVVSVERLGLHSAEDGTDSAKLRITVDSIPQPLKDNRFDVVLVMTESGLRSRVGGGENAGRELTHTGVVRSLTRIADLQPRKSRGYTATLLAPVAKSWSRQRTRAVVFLQDRDTQVIAGAASCSL
ncbi:MAG: DUF1223 domain-containing protein [Acidobacteria bacterium]|nr:DUF1223 domain-containing protein [Acidobacteriota bacterium]